MMERKRNPGALANFKGKNRQWEKGENPGTRISNDASRAVRMARKLCPDAIRYLEGVMNDVAEPTALRVKAAETILHHGMPRGDNSKYLGEESIGTITVRLVMPMEEEKQQRVIDATPLSIESETVGSGD